MQMGKWYNKQFLSYVSTGYDRERKGKQRTGDRASLAGAVPWIHDHLKEIRLQRSISDRCLNLLHEFMIKDYKKVDRRLGDNEDFRNLSDYLHENGIRVVVDGETYYRKGIFAFRISEKRTFSVLQLV